MRTRIIASYTEQMYSTALALLATPFYLRSLGPDGYGLVGVFTLMQLWMQLLDAGLSATLTREAARFGAGATAATEFRALVTLLSRIFLGTAFVLVVAGVVASHWIALHWLKIGALPVDKVAFAVAVMIATAAIRWRTEPFRDLVIGFEHTVWLKIFATLMSTARYGGSIGVLALFKGSFVAFFVYQLGVSVVEAAGVILKSYSLMPPKDASAPAYKHSWRTLRPFLKFSLSIAFSSTVWLFASQFDKLLLSSILPLKSYAAFALAILAATGVALLGMPINLAILPRLTALKAAGEEKELERIYRKGTAFIAALAAPACLELVFFGGQVLWVWTGDIQIAREAGPILALYSMGNCLVAFTTFTYYLQYAHGDMKLHVIGNVGFVILLVPAFLFAATRFGALGTGTVWCIQNTLYLFGWAYVVHRKFAPGLHWRWLGRDIISVALPAVVILALALRAPIVWYGSRLHDFAMLLALGLTCSVACAALIPDSREILMSLIRGAKLGRTKTI